MPSLPRADTLPGGAAGVAGGGMLLIAVLAALFGPLALPPPLEQHLDSRYLAFDGAHLMGTDQFGRDLFARVLHGARESIVAGAAVGLISGLVGGLIGLVSGYVGGKLDLAVQRVVDALMAMPLIVLALALVVALPESRFGVIAALSIGFSPLVVRVTRASALSLRSTPYAEASRAMGALPWAVLLRHVAPNAAGPWLVVVGAQIGAAVLAESSLSFLGFGGPAPNPSLGGLLGGEVQTSLHRAPWLAIWPGAAIAFLVLGVNLVADGLADGLATARSSRLLRRLGGADKEHQG